MANGMAANMPGIAAQLKSSCPDQPPLVKLAMEKPGDTTPMNTSNSKIAMMVMNNSKVAAICTPTMLSVMNTR